MNNFQRTNSCLQSEKLRLALYNYDWTDKSPELKQSIVLMMTAATNPLKISVGGFYSLSMISYRIVSNVANDCNLFIISNRISLLVHNVTLVSYYAVTGAFFTLKSIQRTRWSRKLNIVYQVKLQTKGTKWKKVLN